MDFKDIISLIKQKKEISGIDDSLISELLGEYLKKNNILIENLTKPQLKIVVKDIRSQLRNYAGRFRIGLKDRNKLLEQEDYNALLRTHSSTKERIGFYPKLKELISKLNINSILDLGCGLNPIALAEPSITYYASDINLEELKLIEQFFIKNKIKGKTFFCNLLKVDCTLPEADLCIIFKVFDILGKNDYSIAEKVLEKIKSRYLLASFSTKTLSGKPMNSPRRIWFEKLLANKNYTFEIIKSDNEIFYLAKLG